ncbi:uncharacterized protein M421DRAFT_416436 [Didymella exigua CBS 183.55]|uniref:RNA helicase HEL117 n=1 Tax=Didymella exigua CBS 183.55 TaxID=1150837 RepID=A0A6A5RZR7_9PLEO|nr:uncharacterized protein M421DRAFT_416436 [Didymella exigua CBS 183.55]KAF1932830.1 hypothetical protein M421DRAFT_416436 [Didymella exigua CBS 183.55]
MDTAQLPLGPQPDRHKRSDRERSHKSRRSRSPRRDDDRHGDKKHRSHRLHRSRSPRAKSVKLPYSAKSLSKHDFNGYKPLFQSYLDIQKHIQLDELDEREARGRWKSFVSKWNHGDLARSWYDPSMLKTAQDTVEAYRARSRSPRPGQRESPAYEQRAADPAQRPGNPKSDDSDDEFGPAPPTHLTHQGHGPTIPRFDDLTHRNELRDEENARNRSTHADDVRYERKAERKTQKERMEELAPRADPGSRERQLEKKRETTSTLQSFRDAKEGGDVEMGESELMGDDGIEGYKAKMKAGERVKNEREVRREEIARARAAEREEALSARRAKEAQTMDFLKQIAKERFG